MAQALFDAGDFEGALALASASLEADATNLKGLCLMRLGRVDESIAVFDTLPDNNVAKANRRAAVRTRAHLAVDAADTLFRNGDAAGAAAGYAAVDLGAADDDVKFQAFNNNGAVLMQQARAAEAEKSFAAALALQPDHAAALQNLGIALRALGRDDEALTAFDKCGACAVSSSNRMSPPSLPHVGTRLVMCTRKLPPDVSPRRRRRARSARSARAPRR